MFDWLKDAINTILLSLFTNFQSLSLYLSVYLKVWYRACLWAWLQSCRSMRRL